MVHTSGQALGVSLALCSVAYYWVERGLKALYATRWPGFMGYLQTERRTERYFGFLMGLIITLTSGPVFIAFAATFSGDPLLGWSDRDLALIAVRLTLFISELSRLDKYPVVMWHHAMSLFNTLFCIIFDVVPLPLMIAFAGLISEAPGDALYLATVHGCYSRKWYGALIAFNILQYVAARLATTALAVYVTWSHHPRQVLPVWQLVVLNCSAAVYACYCCYYTYTQVVKLLAWRKQWKQQLEQQQADGSCGTCDVADTELGAEKAGAASGNNVPTAPLESVLLKACSTSGPGTEAMAASKQVVTSEDACHVIVQLRL